MTTPYLYVLTKLPPLKKALHSPLVSVTGRGVSSVYNCSIADDCYSFLSDRLNDSGYVKATDVNKLFHSCGSLEQLEQAKDILARWVGRWVDG